MIEQGGSQPADAGAPPDGTAFLDRLEPGWLQAAYADDPARLGAVSAARRNLGDVSLRYRTLLSRLGPGLDGPGTLADADAWYFILEGTREQSVAEAQAMAITELVAHAAASREGEPRAILLARDDYSAVSGRVPLWQLYERGRSLGVGVQVSAQSWQGLGGDDDERRRICATADGGIWLMRTPYPQPVSELAGTRKVIETATKVLGGVWGDKGSSRVQHAWTADPGIARRLATGQAGYIHGGGCTWVQIARPKPSPLHLPPPPPQPVVMPPAQAKARPAACPGLPAPLPATGLTAPTTPAPTTPVTTTPTTRATPHPTTTPAPSRSAKTTCSPPSTSSSPSACSVPTARPCWPQICPRRPPTTRPTATARPLLCTSGCARSTPPKTPTPAKSKPSPTSTTPTPPPSPPSGPACWPGSPNSKTNAPRSTPS
jgi:hypothetical protein